MEGARFKETMLNKIIIPRLTLNSRFELVTLGSETPTGRYLVAVGDISGQLRLKYIGHAMREKKSSTQLQCAKQCFQNQNQKAEDVKLPMRGFQSPRMAVY